MGRDTSKAIRITAGRCYRRRSDCPTIYKWRLCFVKPSDVDLSAYCVPLSRNVAIGRLVGERGLGSCMRCRFLAMHTAEA